MMKLTDTLRATVPLALVAMLASPAAAVAQDDAPSSTEAAPFLLLPVGARSVSLGRAMTAQVGVESVFWNPAGLATVHERQVVLFRGDDVAGTGTAVSAIFGRPGLGTLSASYYLLDVGSQEITDSDGNFQGRLTARNHLGVVTAATRLFDRVSAGVNFKIVQFRTSCRGTDLCQGVSTTATTYAIDAGVQATPIEGLRIAAMVAHLGPKLQVFNAEQADPLPARVRVAVAFDVVSALTEAEGISGWVALEVQDRLRNPGTFARYIGGELVVGEGDALYLRAGYVWGDLDRDGTRVGMGLRYERFDLSIAKSLASTPVAVEVEPIHVTLAIRF